MVATVALMLKCRLRPVVYTRRSRLETSGAVVAKIRLDTNRNRIPHSRRAARCSRLAYSIRGDKQPRNSKARQWRAVMPVETGESRSVARPTLSEIKSQVKRKKHVL